jgi:AraC-like DNA-binding protein/mannose-6-phosphate isomerase-like protein (cupin superfamily)
MKEKLHRPDSVARLHYIPNQKIAVPFHPHLLYAGILKQTLKWQEEPHSHNFLQIVFIKDGSGTIILGEGQNKRTIEIKRGDIVVYNSNVFHHEKSSMGDPLETIFFGARNVTLDGLPENHLIPEGADEVIHTGSQFELFEQMFSRLVTESSSSQMFSRELSEYTARMILIMILRIISVDDEEFVKKDESFVRAKAYIDQHYLKINSVESLCNDVYISKFHLTHLFKKNLGIPPLQYIIRKKIDMAKVLLIKSDMTIKNIAIRCGYENSDYFCRLFKKHEGMTALEYRQKESACDDEPYHI